MSLEDPPIATTKQQDPPVISGENGVKDDKDVDKDKQQPEVAMNGETTEKKQDAVHVGATQEENKDDTDKILSPMEEENNDNEEELEEGAAEEDALFTNIEQHQQEEEQQGKNQVTDAPVLLKQALDKKDEVKDEAKEESEKTTDTVLQKASQLDFLLSRASEYSNFIARDLDALQESMQKEAEQLQQQAAAAGSGGKKSKKRKASSSAAATASKKSKAALASAHAKDAASRAAAAKGSGPIFVQPPNLAPGCTLKDYQLEGVRWLVSLFENGVSGILADEMGLGKTIQCVALIAHLLTKNVSGPFMIVAPLATLPNWVREFEKWLPTHPVVRYHGTAQERDAMLKGPLHPKLKRNADYPFIVTSYEVAIRDQAKLEKLSEFTMLIVDEGHRLKNHRCTLLTSLKKLKAANRLLLTGTPIQNTLDELWSLLNYVNPTIFDELSVFQSWFGFKDIGQSKNGATDEQAILMEEQKNKTVSKLHAILRPFLLRRVKTDVLKEMPPKKEVIVYSGMSKLQAGYADLIEKGTLRDTLVNQGIGSGRTLSQTNKMMNHRKNVNHPFLFGEPIHPATGEHMGSKHQQLLVQASGKFALLDRMLERLHKDGHQVLIFSQMTSVLNVMEDYLQFRQWKYCRIDGSTNIDERQKQMDVFNQEKTSGANGSRNLADDRYFVFLLSTRAGGLGINLTAADTVVIFDSNWNPHQDSQAMDRSHRIGQTRPVAVYRLLTINSVDIEMLEKQVSKKKLERMTIAGGDFRKAGRRSKGDVMSYDSLQNLLQSDVKDLNAKGGDVEDVKIDDAEFDMIMDRKRLFAEGPDAIPTEGKMYDVLDAAGGDLLGSMKTE